MSDSFPTNPQETASGGDGIGVSGEIDPFEEREAASVAPLLPTTLATVPPDDEQPLLITDDTQLPTIPTAAHNARIRRVLTPISVEAVTIFLDHLTRTGRYAHSAIKAKIELSTITRLRKNDREFSNMCEERMAVFRDRLEKECYRRAVEGWDEAIFDKLGRPVGTVRKFDGKLLELMLKRHIPEFRDKMEVSNVHSGGVLVVPVVAPNAQAWLQQNSVKQDNLLQPPSDTTNVIDAEITVVSTGTPAVPVNREVEHG